MPDDSRKRDPTLVETIATCGRCKIPIKVLLHPGTHTVECPSCVTPNCVIINAPVAQEVKSNFSFSTDFRVPSFEMPTFTPPPIQNFSQPFNFAPVSNFSQPVYLASTQPPAQLPMYASHAQAIYPTTAPPSYPGEDNPQFQNVSKPNNI
jgi:hypothetical protein